MSRTQRRAIAPAVGATTAALLALAGTAAANAPGPYTVHRIASVGALRTAAVGDDLFFTNPSRPELWKSDGTTAGTVMVKSWSAGPDGADAIANLTALDGMLLFTSVDPEGRTELWRSDGTTAGTTVVSHVDLGPASGERNELTAMDGAVFFSAADDVHGSELWRSDGTDDGTALVKDLYPGPGSGEPRHLTVVTDTLFFKSLDEDGEGEALWTSDGTTAGTVLVSRLPVDGTNADDPRQFVAAGDRLFFTAQDEFNDRELWTSDGTTEGTVLVKDIDPGGYHYYGDNGGPQNLVAIGHALYFTASDEVHGRELWRSDGTAEGTVMVADIRPGADTSFPYDLTVSHKALFFAADDGTHGRELWRSDGTAAGTTMVRDINPRGTRAHRIGPTELAEADGTLFFTADDGVHGSDIWASDGTRAGTVLVDDTAPGDEDVRAYGAVEAGGTVFFRTAGRDARYSLWTIGGPPQCHGLTATMKGAGTIVGTRHRDVIVGSAGDDVIRGRGGDDVICAGGGEDSVIGGAGEDVARGGRGKDHLDLRDGVRHNDRGDGGPGRDTGRRDRGDSFESVP
ncbi:ELWxxDGT repeat protein [Nocardioides sp. MH1]|uniref:ELWxxDGT repeat protein n=1 Tax=Nocardioides sp. MH1 TaxID=3242490 RepID=UPI003520F398